MSKNENPRDILHDVKLRCRRGENPDAVPILSSGINSLKDELGLSDGNFTIKKHNHVKTAKGWHFKNPVFCINANPYEIGWDTFNNFKKIAGSIQDKVGWKLNQGGLSSTLQDLHGNWIGRCSTDPNVILEVLKNVNNQLGETGRFALENECDFFTGLPSGQELQSHFLPEPLVSGETVEERLNTEDQVVNAVNAIIMDKSNEVFIPTGGRTTDLHQRLEEIKRDEHAKGKNSRLSYIQCKTVYDKRLGRLDKKCYDIYMMNTGVRDINMESVSGIVVPVGLKDRLTEVFQEYNIDLEIEDQRQLPEPHSFEIAARTPDGRRIRLRPYQQQIVDEAVNKRQGLIELATGGGKTIIATGIMGEIGQDTVFLVPNNSLFLNAKEQIESYVPENVNVGQIGGLKVDLKDDPEKMDINIMSLPLASLVLSGKNVDPEKARAVKHALAMSPAIIFDEAHHIPAKSYKKTQEYSPAVYRYGLTATNFREDGDELEINAGLGDNIGKIMAMDLVRGNPEKGVGGNYLTPPEIYVVNNNDVVPRNDSGILRNLRSEDCKLTKTQKRNVERGFIPTRGKNRWRYIRAGSIRCNPDRNERIVDLTKGLEERGKTTIVFTHSVKHAQKLQREFELAGINSKILTGQTEKNIALTPKELKNEDKRRQKRKALFDRLRTGQISTIIATNKIMGEGVDIPKIDAVVLTDMSKSKINAIQMVGRALRKKEGKEKAVIFDFNDPGDVLKKWGTIRRDVWREQGFPMDYINPDQIDEVLENVGPVISKTPEEEFNIIEQQMKSDLRRKYNDQNKPEIYQEAQRRKKQGILDPADPLSRMKKGELIEVLVRNDLNRLG